MTEEECGDLPIFRSQKGLSSFWKPAAVELQALNSGSAVMLTFAAETHPPVFVQVTKPAPGDSPPVDKAEKFALRLLQLGKDLVAHANRVAKDHPDTGNLTDRLLDLIPRKAQTAEGEASVPRAQSDTLKP